MGGWAWKIEKETLSGWEGGGYGIEPQGEAT